MNVLSPPQLEGLQQTLEQSEIPAYMHAGLLLYFGRHILPGHFLTAVLRNDLQEAVGRADDTNIDRLPAYVRWLYNHAPGGSWGSREAVAAWMEASP